MCNMDCFHCELEDCIMDGVTQEEKEAQDQRDMGVLTVFNPKKEAQKRYRQSEKGKAAQKRYQQSEKGKEVQKEARKRYRQSEKGKEVQKRYQQSEKGKKAQKAAQKRYRQSRKKKENHILNLSESSGTEE